MDYRAYGERDMASGAPMTKDAIFRDYSMTKPVTGVAMMILYEQGKWLPSDPISKFIPEFAHLKVFKGVDADGKMILVDPDHAPTMRELMTHTAGFTYGFFGDTPVDKMYRDAQRSGSRKIFRRSSTSWRRFRCSISRAKAGCTAMSMDIEGYIVEKLSGQSLPDFMRDHIFKPLGMRDAGFYVPADKRSRFVTLYRTGPHGELVADATSGSAGRVITMCSHRCPRAAAAWFPPQKTTIALRRCWRMAVNWMASAFFRPATVKLMTSNHVPAELLTGQYGIG